MPLFSETFYLENNPDIRAALEEGLIPSAQWHFENFGWQEGRNPSPFFDVNFYLEQNPDVDEAGVNPLEHFNEFGWQEGRDPSPFFDVSFYLEQNSDVDEAGINPLLHFLEFGAQEGRSPNPNFVSFADFDTGAYLEANPDLGEAGITSPGALYGHFVTFGFTENRPGTSTKDGQDVVEGLVVQDPGVLDPDDLDDDDDDDDDADAPAPGGGGDFISPGPIAKFEDGVLTLTSSGSYTVEAVNGNMVTIALGERNFEFDATTLNEVILEQSGTQATVDATLLDGLIGKVSGEGTLNLNNFVLAEALTEEPFTPLEVNADLDGIVFDAETTVNGSQSEWIQMRWSILDARYTNADYYAVDINQDFVLLGIEYIEYLASGGEPLTGLVAKSNSAGREQSMHDNLLGNIEITTINDRFSPSIIDDDGALRDSLIERIETIDPEYLDRSVFSGNENVRYEPIHKDVMVFDFNRDWDRPDYVRIFEGEIDAKATKDGSGEEMIFGSGNTVTDWWITRHEGAGIELGLKAKERGGPDEYKASINSENEIEYVLLIPTDGAGVWDWSYDFSLIKGLNDQDKDFTIRLLVDVDPSTDEEWIDLTDYLTNPLFATPVPDGLGGTDGFQGSQNFGFGYMQTFIEDFIGTEYVPTEGDQFAVRLDVVGLDLSNTIFITFADII